MNLQARWISRVWLACLAVALGTVCGDFSFRIGALAFSVVFSAAHAQDDGGGDDGGGDDGGDDGGSGGSGGAGTGAAGGGSASGGGGGGDGGSGSSGGSGNGGNRLFPFTIFTSSDREPNELLAAGLTRAQLNALRQQGYLVIRARNSGLLSREVLRLRIPPSLRLNAAIEQVRAFAPNALVDFNHLFRPSACDSASHQCPAQVRQTVGWGRAASCNVRASIGLIDTSVDTAHPALRGQTVQVLRVRSADREASSPAHGTAVASLLIGRADSSTPGLLPRARLVTADAFHRTSKGDDRMDAFDFAAALDALAKSGVSAINLSFAGPANAVIERSIAQAHTRGMVLVAAVGNDGPTAAPRFPAAYPQVIAVTAVRSDLNVFRRAVRGEHVALAAPGVDVWTAQAPDSRSNAVAGPQTGTSMAAPFVTAAAAVVRSNGAAKGGPQAVRAALLKQTRDLGNTGVDPVYGHGLLQMGRHCGASTSTAAAPARAAELNLISRK